MGKKQEIITSVVNEIESLARYYEEILAEKEEEITELTSITNNMQARIIKLELKNRSLKSMVVKRKSDLQIASITTQQTNNSVENETEKPHLEKSINNTVPMKLDDTLENALIEDKSIILMKYLLEVLDEEDVKAFEIGLNKAIEHIDLFIYKDEVITKLLQSIFVRLFIKKDKFNIVDYDNSFILALNFMTKLLDTPFASTVKSSIQISFNNLMNNILHTNSLKIIIPFLRMCYTYGLIDLLKRALLQIIEQDWMFLKNDLTEEDMFFIFWYSYLTELDHDLTKAMTTEEMNELENKKRYELYFYVYDSEHDLLIPEHAEYSQHIKTFLKGKGLTEIEKTNVLQKTDEIIKLVMNEHDFLWPSTEIDEERKKETDTEIGLKQQSDLRSFGYQITGLNRMERWDILEQAVPTLGLYKVAYTIANHVRLRKGQKNGLKTFRRSITEWEYDLDKLKKIYYKKDFRWPETNLK